MRVWVGTCGYSYKGWVGDFYPPSTKPGQMLSYYSRVFPLVELNFTFYRPPTPTMLARLAEQTPPGFQFLVKLPRTLSHDQDRRDLDGFRRAAEELRRRGQLLGVLCQLPQSCHNKLVNRRWLETVAGELAGLSPAVEFRHYSWNRPDVAPWLQRLGLDLVSVDVPDLPGLYPRGLVLSGRTAYVRLHSRNATAWYGGDKQRYDYDYSDAQLAEWRDALAASDRLDEVLLLFNNCHYTQAVDNARRMRDLLGDGPPFDVVAADADGEPARQQRSLFD